MNVLTLVNYFILGYFVVINLIYTALLFFGWRAMRAYIRRSPLRRYDEIANSELTMPISIVVPAYNEEKTILTSVSSLLQMNYHTIEVIVIIDGGNNETFKLLNAKYQLVPVVMAPRDNLAHTPVLGAYLSPLDDRIIVIDKVNGGKADALNTGIAYARYPLFCTIDSDTLLEREALSRLAWVFQTDTRTIACGGIVRIANNSLIENSHVTQARTSNKMLVNLQILEYLRAFLTGRSGWSALGMLLIVSGAFGLFKRDAVLAVGGYDAESIGEDAELVVRLHRHFKTQQEPYKIAYVSDPVCWTQAPDTLKELISQRDRWQRGLIETLSKHNGMLFRPRYGLIGSIALPYFFIFEMLGPTIEFIGYLFFFGALLLHKLSLTYALSFFFAAFFYGMMLSLGALLIDEISFQRYEKRKDLLRLLLAAVVDNFGYRQLLTLVRVRSWITRKRTGHNQWRPIKRRVFSNSKRLRKSKDKILKVP